MTELSQLPASATKDFLQHAIDSAPNECCGVIVRAGDDYRYIRGENLSDSPETSFALDSAVFDEHKYKGDICYIAHSHVNSSPEPSELDKAQSEACGIPFLIVSLIDKTFHSYKPSGYVQPLEGRPFLYGVADCFSLTRDFYKQELGIEFDDLPRHKAMWWLDESDTYSIGETIASAGFSRVSDELRRGDLLLMRLQAHSANHIAIYLGGNIILHQYMGRPSLSEIYSGFWRKNTEYVMRHERMKDVR